MTDLGPSLLIAASFLALHWIAITGLVADYGHLPKHPLARYYEMGDPPRPAGYQRRVSTVIHVVLALWATVMMGLFLIAGGYMALIGATELGLAAWWLVYLLRASAADC